MPLLKRDCTICVVGALEALAAVNNMQVASHRKSVAGSLIGNLPDAHEVLDFCAEHGIGPDIQLIPIQDINDACKKAERGDARFRYVIDMVNLKSRAGAASWHSGRCATWPAWTRRRPRWAARRW